MLHLFIAISFSTMVSLILKYSETRNLNRLAVTTVNYLFGFMISMVLIWQAGILEVPFDWQAFSGDLFPVLRGDINTFDASGSLLWAIISGIPGGICYFFGFILIQKSIRDNGVGITGAFSKLGIFVPMAVSIFLWRELPTYWQWAGIVLALGAIVSVHYNKNFATSLQSFKKSLILVFFVVGLAEFSNKFFQHYASTKFKALFLFTVFFTAFLISSVFTLKQSRTIKKKDIMVGVLVGLPNMLTSFFLIQSFDTIKAAVAFPLYSSMTIAMITLGGVILFREKIGRKEALAILLTIIAIILMNLG